MIFFRLDGRTPIPVEDVSTWGAWFQTADRTVARTATEDGVVSTVFLGMDHGFGRGAPVLFETMVFGGPMNDYCERYRTWAEAERGHRTVVAQVRIREREGRIG